MDGLSDGCFDGWIQTYVTPGSHLICNAYVLLPFVYGQNATQGSCCWSKMKKHSLDMVIDHMFSL